MNGSTGLKKESRTSSGPDPLDKLRQGIEDGREASKLLAYSDDFDEPTGRTEVTVNLQHPSQPEIALTKTESEAPQSKIAISFVRAVKGWPQALVAVGVLALIAWWLYLKK